MNDLSYEQVMALREAIADPVRFTEATGTINGKPFSFKGRDHLHDIYRDKHPRIVIVASRQVEKSETVARKLMQAGYHRPYTTLTYTAPRAEQVTRFQSERFRQAIKDSTEGILENSVDKSRDAKTATRLTNKSIYYFGSGWSDGDSLRGIPADIVFFDEVQDMTQSAIESIEKSVSHSEITDEITELNGVCFYTGTPKQTGTYYDRVLWGMSDQKHWYVECTECGHEQNIGMNNIYDDETQDDRKYFGCTECRTELDRQRGKWVAHYPDNTLYSSYHLSQLNMSWISANQIWRDYQTMDEMTFNNEVLGKFFAGNTKPVQMEDVLACADANYAMRIGNTEFDCVMGIDYGSGGKSKSIITIGHNAKVDGDTKLVVDYIENCTISNEDEMLKHVQSLVQRFNVVKIVGDIGYGSYEHGKLYTWYGKRAMACRYVAYPGDPGKRDIKESNVIHVDRTFSMDRLIEMFRKHQLVFPYKNPGEIEFAFDHYTSIEMKFTTSNTGTGRKLYDHRTPDDAFHSLNYVREGLYELENYFEWGGVERDNSLDDLFEDGNDVW